MTQSRTTIPAPSIVNVGHTREGLAALLGVAKEHATYRRGTEVAQILLEEIDAMQSAWSDLADATERRIA